MYILLLPSTLAYSKAELPMTSSNPFFNSIHGTIEFASYINSEDGELVNGDMVFYIQDSENQKYALVMSYEVVDLNGIILGNDLFDFIDNGTKSSILEGQSIDLVDWMVCSSSSTNYDTQRVLQAEKVAEHKGFNNHLDYLYLICPN